jgi:hypothetical protein
MIKKNLGYDQVDAFDEKKQMSKISCKCTFKLSVFVLNFIISGFQEMQEERTLSHLNNMPRGGMVE